MIFGVKGSTENTSKVVEALVKESTEENLLGITLEKSLSFKKHVKTLCRMVSQKLHALLARISRYMDTEKLQHLMAAFFLPKFHYSPLVWMFFGGTLNHRIIHDHKRALRIAYKDNRHYFGLLLEQSNSVPVYLRSLQLLMTEIYKTKSDLNPPFIKDIFRERDISNNLKHDNDAKLPKVRTASFGVETIGYLGNKLWQLLPNEIKNSANLRVFKKHIRSWNFDKCNCRPCKIYILKMLGF